MTLSFDDMIFSMGDNSFCIDSHKDNRGLLYIPDEIVDKVERAAGAVNTHIDRVEGNDYITTFYFGRSIEEEEAEEFMEFLKQL